MNEKTKPEEHSFEYVTPGKMLPQIFEPTKARRCMACKGEFFPKRNTKRYCSDVCRWRYNRYIKQQSKLHLEAIFAMKVKSE